MVFLLIKIHSKAVCLRDWLFHHPQTRNREICFSNCPCGVNSSSLAYQRTEAETVQRMFSESLSVKKFHTNKHHDIPMWRKSSQQNKMWNVSKVCKSALVKYLDNVWMWTHLSQNQIYESIANLKKELKFEVLIAVNITEYSLLGCSAIHSSWQVLIFQVNFPPPS